MPLSNKNVARRPGASIEKKNIPALVAELESTLFISSIMLKIFLPKITAALVEHGAEEKRIAH